ncbi:transglutaminase domain-containing protein [Rasiella sp. SM2506]|uniref:transglutaminase domain-containing protein n=1 Tax=Rasiella sp. SM2506 TaxID=3423914 RepID=UPI003D7A909B
MKLRYFTMSFRKLKPLFFLVSFLLSVGITTPMTAQGKTIIGKRATHKKSHNTRNKPKAQPQKANTKNLAEQITRGKTTDAEKAKSIFTWIATTIEYDNELRLNRKLQKEIYTSEANVITQALRRKKALCGGYAFLFQQLCEDVGVKAEIIHGFTVQGTEKKNTSGTPEHTWNAVFLDGQWQLLDITWAVSHGSLKNPQWFWYHTKPSDFIKTHLPQNKKWRLTQASYVTK